MTTSHSAFLSEILAGEPIPLGKLAYFRERLRNKLHEIISLEFIRQHHERGLTKADMARRIGRKPEQVTRWLGAPGNWTLDTVSDLLLAMGSEMEFTVMSVAERFIRPDQPAAGTAAEMGIWICGEAQTSGGPFMVGAVGMTAITHTSPASIQDLLREMAERGRQKTELTGYGVLGAREALPLEREQVSRQAVPPWR
jgi:DNA-binding phage protein